MKGLSRAEVREAFNNIVEKFGEPTNGDIYCVDHLISQIAHTLCCYGEVNITYESGHFTVSPSLSICKRYSPDHTFIGTVFDKEWYSRDQLLALHEVGYGYKF